MRIQIVKRFLWSWFLLLAAGLLLLDTYVPGLVFETLRDGLQRQVTNEARILAVAAPSDAMQLQGWVKREALETQARVTVLDREGALIADSGPGSAGEELAANATLGDHSLKLSVPLDPLRAEVDGLRYWLWAGSFLIWTLAGAFAYIFARAFSRRMALLRTYTDRLLDPDIGTPELPSADDQLGSLAQSLRRMVPRIREVVESLRLESARREAILGSMVEGVLAVDQNLRVIFCNHSFARTVGARIPVSQGMQLLELVRAPALIEIMNEVLASGQRVEGRLTLPAADPLTFEVLAGPLAGASTRGALAILHDVTDLERLERVRSDFVANVSHELRTPLAAIHGYAETLLDGALDDQEHNRRFVEIIQSQAARLGNIASDLLILSELESIADAPKPQRVSIGNAIDSALRTVESAARARGVKLVGEKVADLTVAGHQLRLEQVFVNLLDNAVKFNRPNGEVRIRASAENGMAQISVADTGIGIPSEDLPRIFERFYRVDKARSREQGGTGLGLSIVKHAIEQMGGTLTVESQVGEGSRFVMNIPLMS
jgi:two-component system phosphate regulon sensor histidine kinase PhoR